MASVVIAGDTSGTVTLAAPAVAGTTTLTLPTANGTVITTGSSAALPVSAINATGTPSATTYLRGDSTWSTISSGAVLQVKQGQTNTQQSFADNSWTDLSGLTIGITPTSASNKILVIATVWVNGDSASANLYARLNRNGTIVGVGSNDTAGYAGNGGYRGLNDGQDTLYNIHNIGFTWLDSPATTSALTYKIQGLTNGGNYYFNQSQPSGSRYFFMYSTITVMEVTP